MQSQLCPSCRANTLISTPQQLTVEAGAGVRQSAPLPEPSALSRWVTVEICGRCDYMAWLVNDSYIVQDPYLRSLRG